MFKVKELRNGITFDDVLLVPAASDIHPSDTDLRTKLTPDIELNIPLISSAMDTVTTSKMAIAMAQNGGIGIVHRNMTPQEQSDEVRKVKRFEAGMVVDPITVSPNASLSQALEIMEVNRISGIPVTEDSGKLVGIITNRDVRFAENPSQAVRELMTKENLVTITGDDIDMAEAKRLLHKNRIEKLLVVDDAGKCTGLITVKDIERSRDFPLASKDSQGRLRVGAAIGTGRTGMERVEAFEGTGIDVVVVDTAHGHSHNVLDTVRAIRQKYPDMQIMAGNVATGAAAQALIECGANAIKVGIGPGSICTTRVVAGVGVPQLTAIMDVAEICAKAGVTCIADGGIKYSGDFAKAIAAGAHSAMIGSMFAGTDEAPGEVILYQGRSYKSYRGMGSVGAMARGSADRYFQGQITESQKFVPEGIEGRVPYKGPIANVLHQMVGGLRASMGYTGCKTVLDMHEKAEFVKMTASGFRESHVHDVTITQEAPNYRVGSN